MQRILTGSGKGWSRSAGLGLAIALIAIAFVAGRYSEGLGTRDDRAARRVLYYVDPMHPSYRADTPGTAPDCGMDLVPVFEDEAPPAAVQTSPGAASISAERQQQFGIGVETVRREPGQRLVRTTGRVEVDGDRLHRLMAGAEGWVESVQNNPVGTLVKKGELLAMLYSREFRNAQQAYLGSLASLDRLRSGRTEEDPGRGNDLSLRNNEEQLRALGMSEVQIRELGRERRVTSEISLNAPVDGIVLVRDISPGQKFEEGSEFYRIADLSRVWITADVFGEDARAFRTGVEVRVSVRERAASVTATVGKAPPFFDSASRTLKVRLEAGNPGFVLRPDMFVDIEVPVRTLPALTVPVDAVLDSGLQERVFVEREEGVFEPRAVVTGWRSGGRVEIVRGLAAGERVVTSGTFLVDSESRLRATAARSTVAND